MTPAGEILRDEIRRNGPISFHRFMEVALYHPEQGYYRRQQDPFGIHGDFYTAEQLQPMFGILIAARIRQLRREMGDPPDFMVVELGAGRAEMAEALSEFDYRAIEIDRGGLPESFTGVVFSNEFFDALPVHRVEWRDGVAHESLVNCTGTRFSWETGPIVDREIAAYIDRFLPGEREIAEVNLDALRWMSRIAASYVFTIDYGYTTRESVRFPTGTLMSYRRHTASEDVLADPGERDITAHVCFSALESQPGLQTVKFEPLSRTLLDAGEPDQFAAALAGPDEARRRQQLKSLLFGMGETFRVLLQKRE